MDHGPTTEPITEESGLECSFRSGLGHMPTPMVPGVDLEPPETQGWEQRRSGSPEENLHTVTGGPQMAPGAVGQAVGGRSDLAEDLPCFTFWR